MECGGLLVQLHLTGLRRTFLSAHGQKVSDPSLGGKEGQLGGGVLTLQCPRAGLNASQ